MEKSFSHAGVSRRDGAFKVRFGNSIMRVKIFSKVGDTDIDIIELKHPMTKVEAVEYLLSIGFGDPQTAKGVEITAALSEYLADGKARVEKAAAPAVPKQPRVKKVKAVTTVEAAAPAVDADADATEADADKQLEDAPF